MGKVAILLSTYNGNNFLDEQLESLYNQKCSHEITIYARDDGSTDDTKIILDKWSKKINVCFFEGENSGPALSFWELFTNPSIQADYYAFCDQDDIWDEDKLEKEISCLTNNIHLCASNCRIIDKDSNLVEEIHREKDPIMKIESLFVSGISQGCSMVFTDELRKYILCQKINTVPMHDLVVSMYALCLGDIAWIKEPLFSYRVHDGNVVAREKGRKLRNLKKTIVNWGKNKNVMKELAKDLLDNSCVSNPDTIEYLHDLVGSGLNIKNKIRLLKNPNILGCERKALRSYRIRVILGII